MEKQTKVITVNKPEKIIVKNGYEYHLVECPDRSSWKIRSACALGFPGWVLKSVNKIV
jgi:hypothetical protein